MLALPELLHAQDILDEIEIIANEDEAQRTGDVVESEHTGSRSRIPSTRLQQPGSQLGNLLSSTSGVQQLQAGGYGTFSSVTVRAASAAQTAVFLDGILLNSSGSPIIDLSTLEILNLASVDIYKGSAPLQLGHATMGGAVNLSTNKSKTGARPTIRLGVGSYSQASFSVAHQLRSGKWDWTSSASHQQSENDFPFTHNNGTPLNLTDDPREIRQNSQVRRSSVLLKTGYQSTALKRTDVLFQIAKRDIGVPTVVNTAGNNASYETLNSQLQLSQTIDQWRDWNTRHSLYWHQFDSLYDDSQGSVGLGKPLVDTDTDTLGTKTYWEKFINVGTLGLSIDARRETLNRENPELDAVDVNANRNLALATAHLAFIDASEKVLVTPAIRWQQSSQEATSTSKMGTINRQSNSESEFGMQLGISLTVKPSWTLNANVGNFFREPSFGELFGSIGLYRGNPNLDSEKGLNMDISLAYDNDTLQMEATVFQNLRDELIVTSYDARGNGRASNTGKADVTGLELSLGWTPSSLWHISANATLQNPRNRNPEKGFSGKLLPGEAKQAAFARVQYQPSHMTYWYEWQATRTRFYDDTNGLPAADTSLHHIGVDITHGPWKFGARLQNASNDTVEDFNGFPKPGRSFSMAVTRTL